MMLQECIFCDSWVALIWFDSNRRQWKLSTKTEQFMSKKDRRKCLKSTWYDVSLSVFAPRHLISCESYFSVFVFLCYTIIKGYFKAISPLSVYRQTSGGWHAMTKPVLWNDYSQHHRATIDNPGETCPFYPSMIKTHLDSTHTKGSERPGPAREMHPGCWVHTRRGPERATHAHTFLICEAWCSSCRNTEYSSDLTVQCSVGCDMWHLCVSCRDPSYLLLDKRFF